MPPMAIARGVGPVRLKIGKGITWSTTAATIMKLSRSKGKNEKQPEGQRPEDDDYLPKMS